MTLIQSIVLGIIQGLTEFIPVSSSGHLVIIPEVFNWQMQSEAFDVIVHAGSLLSLLIYFNKDLISFLKDKKLIINILIASLPALLIGYFFHDFIGEQLKSIWIVVVSMITVGFIMIFADKIFKEHKESIEHMEKKDALLMGVAQVFALIRGVSRSGITILAGLARGLNRKEAAKFSFLMAIPVIGAATAYEIFKMATGEIVAESAINLFAGFFTSLLSSLIAIKFMLKFLEKQKLAIFGVYRIILGLILLLLIIF